MSNYDDGNFCVSDALEHERFLANELAVMGNELERARATLGSAQEVALGTAIHSARVSARWSSGRENLRGPSQALMELAKRVAWREGNEPIGLNDLPRLIDVAEKARRVEPRSFLSQHSEAIGAFKAAMAELDSVWDYEEVRRGFLRIISGGRDG